jgi:hypothetical protein
MKDFTNQIYIWTLGCVAGIGIGVLAYGWGAESRLIRDCSMTRVHIIDNDTLISCTVLKVNRTETPIQDDKKPEISL